MQKDHKGWNAQDSTYALGNCSTLVSCVYITCCVNQLEFLDALLGQNSHSLCGHTGLYYQIVLQIVTCRKET